MINNNHTDLPMDPNENSSHLQIFNSGSVQHNLNDNIGVSNINLNTLNINTINTETSTSQNATFEFYLHLPNDTRIYHVTYSELHPSENIRLLNNGINLSHIPVDQFPHHHNVHSLIRQQIQQRVQQPVQQQSFDTARTQDTPQMYLESTSIGNTFSNMQEMGYAGVLDNKNNP
ncbi:hypothetical protein RclHR1_04840006 [Rhizophagus clarus]|uniref:Uncharacterized protein n=1 Tax=Rhizophagus clarus TaxID=94130 RepID=A0A2Z6RPJ2_9GLOM|nr:hypothetical protein RclHR1_04840006 [Rhizophagus clarus]GET03653.1 hypothetical protein GLOIN_2v1781313 [Rhizophagus clarus]